MTDHTPTPPSTDQLRAWAADGHNEMCWGLDSVADELERLQREIAKASSDAKDAARWRWWCKWWFDVKDDMETINDLDYEGKEGLDAEIDAAIAKNPDAIEERFIPLPGVPVEALTVNRLHAAATALYEAGHWRCDRPVDEIGLWTELRDALERNPGGAPKPIEARVTADVNDADIAQLVVELRANRMEIIQNGTCAYMSPRPYGLWVNWHLVERAIAALQIVPRVVPRHAASCLSWRSLPCNCREAPPKEREL